MRKEILNIINQILSYNASQGTTDSPMMRSFDWTRRMTGLSVGNPQSDNFVIAPGQSVQIFNGSKANPMDNTSVLAIESLGNSIYRLKVESGASGFRSARSVSLTTCDITINNNSLAVFDFDTADLSSVVTGDILRVKGSVTGEAQPYAFNPMNAGNWIVIGKSGSTLSCIRPVGEPFAAAAESVADASDDILIYSSQGIQKGDKINISGTFSVATYRTYEIKDATPEYVDFISTVTIPLESGLSYIDSTINFYITSKKFIYMESDQVCMVQFNGSTDTNNKIVPVVAGSATMPGFLNQIGDFYSCTITNASLNLLNLKVFTGE